MPDVVQVSAKAEPTGVADRLELHTDYFRTLPGALKILQLVLGAVCMGCASPVVTAYTSFFMFVVALYFALALLFCAVYLFGVRSLWTSLPWNIIELCCSGSGALLHFIVGVAQLAATDAPSTRVALLHHHYYSPYMAAGCFGLFNSAAFGAGAFFLFMEWRGTP